jgi:hypothetical protein
MRRMSEKNGNFGERRLHYDCHMYMIDYRYNFLPSHTHFHRYNLIDVFFEFYLIFVIGFHDIAPSCDEYKLPHSPSKIRFIIRDYFFLYFHQFPELMFTVIKYLQHQ